MSVEPLNFGSSAQGRPLEAFAFGRAPWILVLGAVHGDEIEGLWVVDALRDEWYKSFSFTNVGVVLWNQVNPDGVAAAQRWNGNRVDLNRNLPTQDWTAEMTNPRYPPGASAASEPENKALVRLIDEKKPIAIFTLHSFKNYQVNANGPARAWAEHVASFCDYPVTEDIGYPTPGSLGTYAGKERHIPTITLEIERGLPKEKVLALHLPTTRAAIAWWDEQLGRKTL